MNEQRDFKGVWFPKEVWLDSRLNALDKIILLEIDSLDCEEKGCYASNEYLANFCQCSERKITESISKLIELDYIYLESFNGRVRILKSCLAKNERQTSKICEAESQKMKGYKSNINKNNNIDKESIINNNTKEIFDYWNEKKIHVHRDISDFKNKIDNALKEHSVEEIKLAIEHYKEILDNPNYFYKYKWTLNEFLGREKGYKEFLDNGSKWENYKLFKEKEKSKNPYKPNEEISRETAYPELNDYNVL